jgi:hypothetical protein
VFCYFSLQFHTILDYSNSRIQSSNNIQCEWRRLWTSHIEKVIVWQNFQISCRKSREKGRRISVRLTRCATFKINFMCLGRLHFLTVFIEYSMQNWRSFISTKTFWSRKKKLARSKLLWSNKKCDEKVLLWKHKFTKGIINKNLMLNRRTSYLLHPINEVVKPFNRKWKWASAKKG